MEREQSWRHVRRRCCFIYIDAEKWNPQVFLDPHGAWIREKMVKEGYSN
jgi:hypothetical protein